MKISKTKIIVLSVVSPIVLLIFWVLTRPPIESLFFDISMKPDFEFFNPVFINHKNNKDDWRLYADRAQFYKDNGKVYIYNATANFEIKDNEYVLLIAPTANMNIKGTNMTFYNSTVSQSGKDYKMKSDILYYDHKRKLINGEGNVKLKTSKLLVNAGRIKINPVDNTYVIDKSPRIEIDIK